MSWLFPHHAQDRSDERFRAAVAANIAAQHRAVDASDDALHAADESRESVEAAVSGLKVRTQRRLQSRAETLDDLLARRL